MTTKIIFTALSLAFGFITFLPYYVEIFERKARPHVFSWLIWALIGTVGFIISLTNGGAGGSLIIGLQAPLCLVVVTYGLFLGEKNITRLDWISLVAAIILAVFYFFTKQAVISIILAVTIDVLGFVPTFRKSYFKPQEEPILTYFFSAIAYSLSVGGIRSYNFVTMLNPVTLTVANASLVAFLFIRKKALQKQYE